MKASIKWFLASAVLGAAVLLFLVDPAATPLAPKCPVKMLTGWDCPGCGFQRAAHALLHGKVLEAWAYNRFLIFSFPYLLVILATEYVWTGERQERWRRIFESKTALWVYVIATCVWWVVRNL
ncbi:MAG: DUF2752 domain-containing protein [Alloprevotella sp.]